MNLDSKIYVAGHNGLAGSAIIKSLQRRGYKNLLIKTHAELELTDQSEVTKFFEKERPEYVFLAAAKVGGIAANNTYRADFIYQNHCLLQPALRSISPRGLRAHGPGRLPLSRRISAVDALTPSDLPHSADA